MVYAHGVFSAHAAHDLDTKTVELYAKRIMQGGWGLVQVKKLYLLSVLAAKMANNQLLPFTFS